MFRRPSGDGSLLLSILALNQDHLGLMGANIWEQKYRMCQEEGRKQNRKEVAAIIIIKNPDSSMSEISRKKKI